MKQLFIFFVLTFSGLVSFAQISGIVYRDYNGNGSRETATTIEPFMGGITVNAYNASEVLLASTVSAAIGTTSNYSFTSGQIPSGTAVRLEFIVPTSYSFSSFHSCV